MQGVHLLNVDLVGPLVGHLGELLLEFAHAATEPDHLVVSDHVTPLQAEAYFPRNDRNGP